MGYGKKYIIGSFNVHNLSSRTIMERAYPIADIINTSGMDLVALQEVLDDGAIQTIVKTLNRGINKWESTKKLQPKLRREGEKLLKDTRGDLRNEGYAFIWNKTRLKKVDTTLANGQKRVYEPTIFSQYKIDRSIGEKELVRDPLYGRFTPRGLGGGNFEIRIICTHIRFNGNKGENDPSYLNMRRNELNILSKALYPKLADKKYGNNMPSYTILLGDYNMNLKSSGINGNSIENEEFFVSGNQNMKKMITVQDQRTTLKKKSENSTVNTDGQYLANNYDHFTYDALSLNSIHPRYKNVDVIGNAGYHSCYYANYEKYSKEVSDHLPVIIELCPNINSL